VREYGHLVGHRFPRGTYTLPAYVCWLWSDSAHLPPVYDPHPGLAYLVAQYGLGAPIEDILALMDASAESGAVTFGEFGAEFHAPLRAGAAYECDAEILEVERKRGRRSGVFDKLTFLVTIREKGSDTPTVSCTNVWIFPRGDA
jgi:hypothetical protein